VEQAVVMASVLHIVSDILQHKLQSLRLGIDQCKHPTNPLGIHPF